MEKIARKIRKQFEDDMFKAITGTSNVAENKEPFTLEKLEAAMDLMPNNLVVLSWKFFAKGKIYKVSDKRYDMIAMHPDDVLKLRIEIAKNPKEFGHIEIIDASKEQKWRERFSDAWLESARRHYSVKKREVLMTDCVA